jgi:osmotically-inducible protein OsmY
MRSLLARATPAARCALLTVALSWALFGCASPRCASSACRLDARITADVRAHFAQHPALEAPNQIDIQVIDRVVYLKGLVGTPYQQALAAEVAGEVQGVVRVVNDVALDNNR